MTQVSQIPECGFLFIARLCNFATIFCYWTLYTVVSNDSLRIFFGKIVKIGMSVLLLIRERYRMLLEHVRGLAVLLMTTSVI